MKKRFIFLPAAAILFLAIAAVGQQTVPTNTTVTQVDDLKLKQLLKPKNDKPLLVNFWATWCGPCREEFPDLVEIDREYRGRIEFITVSLDDVADINGAVPKFLLEMKSTMPAYLLVSQDESAIISAIARDWTGGLPFTVLYDQKGATAYFRQGKVKPEILRAEINKLAAATKAP